MEENYSLLLCIQSKYSVLDKWAVWLLRVNSLFFGSAVILDGVYLNFNLNWIVVILFEPF